MSGVAPLTGADLIAWGFKPARWFKAALAEANAMRNEGASDDAIFAHMQSLQPVEIAMRTEGKPFAAFIEAGDDIERANVEAVAAHMDALMRVPTIVAGAVMPDACPSGAEPGTIPVGGVVACEDAIHPGFHSADICCSMALSVFRSDIEPKTVVDAALAVTHFGPTARARPIEPPREIMAAIAANALLSDLEESARRHFGTQGDGNHFLFVGRLRSTGKIAVVTHHGSRSLGALLYKKGMALARKHTAIVAPRVPTHNAWIKASSRDGETYWDALQIVRLWTKANHFAIHDLLAAKLGVQVVDRFWNEHNYVFRKDDGRFYHAKGATPSWRGFSADDDGRTLIPLNMAAPILVTSHVDRPDALGFAPHGAGRNLGRRAFLRARGDAPPSPPAGLDIRAYLGRHDPTEFPEAYKDSVSVRAQIESFGLARVEDEILPLGGIMAGEWSEDPPWKRGP